MCQGTKICNFLKNMINIIKKMTFYIKKLLKNQFLAIYMYKNIVFK